MTIIIYKRLKHLCLIRMRSARAPRGFIYSVSEKSVPLKASSGRQREGFVCGVHHWWAATPCYSSLYISSLYLYFCVFLCLYLCICIDVFVPMACHPLLLLFKHTSLHNVDSTTSQSQKIPQIHFLTDVFWFFFANIIFIRTTANSSGELWIPQVTWPQVQIGFNDMGRPWAHESPTRVPQNCRGPWDQRHFKGSNGIPATNSLQMSLSSHTCEFWIHSTWNVDFKWKQLIDWWWECIVMVMVNHHHNDSVMMLIVIMNITKRGRIVMKTNPPWWIMMFMMFVMKICMKIAKIVMRILHKSPIKMLR